MQDWSFAGIFGTYDTAQLQRGFQVYTENCSACHALSRVAFRNLMEPGGPAFSEAEVRAIAANYFVEDGPDSFGEMFEREARLSDRFPPPFPNREAAVAAMGAYPPDFSCSPKRALRPAASRTSCSTFSPAMLKTVRTTSTRF
jgi:ubiquinol-cytochrome c reductase cytochrome c1 subunit